ncbi:MAG: type II toxin-antitoxin system Phd/YefM family antitoxin [Elusimicrobia bacterium]|nr:type II toxin-antitoxin system Phd/YefM family antitoxin [Elusimicrobiota bacterium]
MPDDITLLLRVCTIYHWEILQGALVMFIKRSLFLKAWHFQCPRWLFIPLDIVYFLVYTLSMTQTINLKELRPQLPRVMQAVDQRLDRFIVTRRGYPLAVIMSPDDYQGLLDTLDLLEDKAGLARLKRAKREIRTGKTRPIDEIRRSLTRV